jgi:hypothetical protein
MDNPGVGPGIATDAEMAAHHKREMARIEREAAEQEKAKKEAEAAALRAEQKDGEQLIAAEKERLKEAWIRSGGTAAEFAADWPDLRTGLLLERIAEREARSVDARSIWGHSRHDSGGDS